MRGRMVRCALWAPLAASVFMGSAASAEAIPVCVQVQEKTWIEKQTNAESVNSKESLGEGKVPAEPSGVAANAPPQAPDVAAEADPPITSLEPQPANVAAPESPSPPPPPPPPPAIVPRRGMSSRAVPLGVEPARYLARLLEYQVTHDAEYEAVKEKCRERLEVELYPLERGFTVFARFSQYAREEKIDRVQLDEFGALADRLARALLSDTNVQSTLTRENVLRNDSEEAIRRVHSQSHFMLALGTALRFGQLDTSHGGRIDEDWRVASPLVLSAGARNKFRSWALDPFVRLQLGMGKYVPSVSEQGGHVDFGGSGALGLHFLRYANPPGIGSLYYGGGAHFEVARYAITRAGQAGRSGDHDGLWSGGLNVDLLLGYEFMRASSLHFFLQLEATLPAYTVDGRNRSGRIDNAYVPSLTVQVGLLL